MIGRRNSDGSDNDAAKEPTFNNHSSDTNSNDTNKRRRRNEAVLSKDGTHVHKKHTQSEQEPITTGLHRSIPEATNDDEHGSASSFLLTSQIGPRTADVCRGNTFERDGMQSLQHGNDMAAVQTLTDLAAGRTATEDLLPTNRFPQREISDPPSASMEWIPSSVSPLNQSFLSQLSPEVLHPYMVAALANNIVRPSCPNPFTEYLLFKSCPDDLLSNWRQLHFQQPLGAAAATARPFAQGVATLPNNFTSPHRLTSPYESALAQFHSQQQQLSDCIPAPNPMQELITALEDRKQSLERSSDRHTGNSLQSNPDSNPGLGLMNDTASNREQDSNVANEEPCSGVGLILACPEDRGMLNDHLVFLRQHIEYFRATIDDIMSHTRGRNKGIAMRQVGIRCRHCSHIPAGQRRKGSTYFPSTLMGIYQAAQNINVEHLQSGLCPEMPDDVKCRFERDGSVKSASPCAGKAYWAESARTLGLVDTQDGIRFASDVSNSRWMPASLRY